MVAINPYNSRGMLPVDSDMFFGREREMRRIEDMLSPDSPQCVSIVGERRIGKSSLAYRVFHTLEKAPGILAVYLDCDRISGDCKSRDQFFQLLAQRFREALEEKPGIEQLPGKSNPFDSYTSFEAFIENRGHKKAKTIIFLDEFEHLPEKQFADDAFFSNLRAAAGNPENRLAFVTISQSNLKDITHKSIRSSSFWNIFQTEMIGLLDPGSIDRLRRYGFEKTGFSLIGEEMENIHYYAGDFPFFNQMACGFLWDSKGPGDELNWDKLEVQIFPHYEKLWEDRTGEEQKRLKDLGKIKSEDNIIFKNMEVRGLLEKKGSSYFPFSGYFSLLIDQKKYIEWVKQEPENIDALKELKNAYEKSAHKGDKDKAKEIEERLSILKEQKDFEFNLEKPITLRQLELHDLYFFDNLKWTFQPGMNVLLGRNGYGKTYLLRLAAAMLQKNREKTSAFFKYSEDKENPYARLILERNDETETILRNKILFEESIGKVPLLAIPDIRFVDKSKMSISPTDDEKSDLRHHGAYHFLYQVSPEKIIENFLFQLCITYLDKGKRLDLPIFDLIHKIIGELSESKFEFHRIEPIGRARFQIDVIFEGNNKPMPLQLASQGTLSILAIFGMIYAYLKELFPGIPENEVIDQPGIVFIDELDAHLHPAWQQKIVRLLRESFPNVQFIVTAHSPLVVAGCLEGEAAVLRKGEKGFNVHVFPQDFIGWEAKELYGKVFQVEVKDETYLKYFALSPFKQEIEEKISALEEKQKKKSLSDEEENELNRLYDEIYYMEKAVDKYRERTKYSRLSIENRLLKNKIKRLEKRDEKQIPTSSGQEQ